MLAPSALPCCDPLLHRIIYLTLFMAGINSAVGMHVAPVHEFEFANGSMPERRRS